MDLYSLLNLLNKLNTELNNTTITFLPKDPEKYR